MGEREEMQAKARRMGLGFADLGRVTFDPRAIELIPLPLIKQYSAIPIKKDGPVLYVATANPENSEVLEAMRIQSECRVVPVIATPTEIEAAIQKYVGDTG